MKITLNYNVSVTFDIVPSDIVDALDPDATFEQIAACVDETIGEMASDRIPTFTAHGRDGLITKVVKLIEAAK